MIAIRDRFGIKPLFYAVIDGGVVFASEMKALLALGVRRCGTPKRRTRTFHVPLAWRSMFAGIRTVPPGYYAIARGGEVQVYRYWDWDFPTTEETAADDRTEAEVVKGFRAVLERFRPRAAGRRRRGRLLSQRRHRSCAVLGLAQRAMDRPIRAYTLAFDDPLYDETPIARRQAEFVGACFHPIPVTRRALADAYTDAVWHAETPFVNGHGVAKFLLQQGRARCRHQGRLHRRRLGRDSRRLRHLPARSCCTTPAAAQKETEALLTRCSPPTPPRAPSSCSKSPKIPPSPR